MSESNAAELSPEQIVAMFPPIAQSMEAAANRAGISPTEMQSDFWNRALHGQ